MTADQIGDPASIEKDVERTQDAIGETVQKIEDRLSPGRFARSLLGEGNANAAQEAWEVVRVSPLPVAMIVGGAAWLLATSDAPLVRRARDELKRRLQNAFSSESDRSDLRPRSAEPAPIGPPPAAGERYDRRAD